MAVSGTPRGLELDGIAFNLLADVDVSEMGGSVEVEMIPTSGASMKKMTRRSQTRESVVVACDDQERELLQALSERVDNFPMVLTTAAGGNYHATGAIEFENRTLAENRATLKLLPVDNWTLL